MMEILQTIWTSLTTENEMLINILSIPMMFIETFVTMLVYIALLNIECSKRQKILYVFIVSILGLIARFIIPNPYNIFINFITVLLAILFILKTSFLKSIACLFVTIIISALIESIFAKLHFAILGIDFLTVSNIPIHRIVVALLIYLFWFILSKILKYFRLNFNKLQVLDKKKKVLLVSSTIFGIIMIGLQFYIMTFYVSFLPFLVIILNLATLIIYFGISFYTMFTTSKLEYTSTTLEEAKLYNKTLEILQDNTRAFRHDFANILQGMVGYMDNNDMEGLRKYYSQLVDDIQTSNNLTTLSPKVVNNPAIYNVLANKYHKADSLGIKIHLESFLDMNNLHMKIYEFTRVLGILMDNAIEATSECDEKIINVTFRKDPKRNAQLLIIENTYKDKNINTDKIFEKGYSTKEGNTGLGLWEVRQILKKNNNLNLFTNKNEMFFIQQFEIFY